jgi:hypothetical protein
MITLFCLFLTLFASPFKSKSRLEAENAALRHQLIILRRKVRGRVRLTNGDRLFLIQLYRWFPSVLKSITIIRPETLVRWHRSGFRRLSFPKIRSGLGSPREAETLHHPGRPDLISGRDNFTHQVGSFLGAWAGGYPPTPSAFKSRPLGNSNPAQEVKPGQHRPGGAGFL